MTTFSQFGLPELLVASLERMQITTPTPIQRETIPIALEGQDVLASAQTGTGKTIAYLIPLIVKLANDKDSGALILAPTRELAMQVHQSLNQILGNRPLYRSALLIGGAPMFKQMQDLRKRPRVIVGTPGRINDHLQRGSLSLDLTRFLVIDEADRMLDMGFGIQLDRIAEYLPAERQTVLFSATFPPNIEKLSQKYLQNPKRIAIDASIKPAPKIKQEMIEARTSEKRQTLFSQLTTREGSVIVFVRTKRRADSLSEELKEEGHNASAIHGDLRQNRREHVIRAFRSGKSRILVATDVAARGLDIPHVMHVINYDLPECPEDYVHRIGRTGRADAEGFALSFVSPEERHLWKAIQRLLNPGESTPYDADSPPPKRPPFKKAFNKGRRPGNAPWDRPRGDKPRENSWSKPRGDGKGDGRSDGRGDGKSRGPKRPGGGKPRSAGANRAGPRPFAGQASSNS